MTGLFFYSFITMQKYSRYIVFGTGFVVSLIIYTLSLCRVPFVGTSVEYLNAYLGFSPFPALDGYFWGALIKVVAQIFPDHGAVHFNAMSVLCGAISTGFIMLLAFEIPHNRSLEEQYPQANKGAAAWISTCVTGCFFMLLTPVWIIFTRNYLLAYQGCIFLAWLSFWFLTLKYCRNKWWLWWLISLSYGLGLAEFGSFIFLFPLWSISLIIAAYSYFPDKFWRVILGSFLLALAGLFPLLLISQSVSNSHVAEWMGWETAGDVLYNVLRRHFAILGKLIPKTGWLLILLSCFAPLAIVLSPKKVERNSWVWSSVTLHLVLLLPGVLVLFNLPLSPWSMFKFSPLMITPYIGCALSVGYLSGYFYLITAKQRKFDHTAHKALKRSGRLLMPLLFLAAFSYAGFNSFRLVRMANDPVLSDWTSEMVAEQEEGDQLVAKKLLIELLRYHNWKQDKSLNLICPELMSFKMYRASLADTVSSPELKGLVEAGLYPFLYEMITENEAAANTISLAHYPDFWVSLDMAPVPYKHVYKAAQSVANDTNYISREMNFIEQLEPEALKANLIKGNPLEFAIRSYLKDMSHKANNFGVYLEQQGQAEQAAIAYAKSRALNEDNVSALLNLNLLAQKGILTESETAQVQQDFLEVQKKLDKNYPVWGLSHHYGYVFAAGAYLQRGYTWAISGNPKRAINEIKKAVQLSQDNKQLKASLASLYFQDENLDASRSIARALISDPKEENQQRGYRALFNIALKEGNVEEAIQYIDRAFADADAARFAEVSISQLLGEYELAREQLELLVQKYPRRMQLRLAQAILALDMKDTPSLDRAMKWLGDHTQSANAQGKLLYVQLLTTQGKTAYARSVAEDALRKSPNHVGLHEFLLRSDVGLGFRDKAMIRVKHLLSLEPHNAYGLLVLGTAHFEAGDYALAKASFQKSVDIESSLASLNSLAYTKHLLGENTSALILADKALAISPEDPDALDTKGMILLKLGELEEAEQLLLSSIKFQPRNMIYYYHLALVYEAKGRHAEGLKLINDVLKNIQFIPVYLQDEVLDTRMRLKKVEELQP